MHKYKGFILATLLLWVIDISGAEIEKSVSVELPSLTVAAEFGISASDRDYVAASLFAGPEEAIGAELNWTRAITPNQSHWLGLGVGHLDAAEDNFVITFNIGTYASLNYKYFKNGLDSSGFYFNTSVRFRHGDIAPWLGFGYNF